jgi:hypothetical protein
MAFSMKVAQGGLTIDKCPQHVGRRAGKALGSPNPHEDDIRRRASLGGETVLLRHEKEHL